ncbi:sel1 repeat family protein [Leeia sp. TBRC 13508]|uniref:Sel1 repeat family protein n=1 Tax=Leeia speluncae TaxID=2884804 RepID=A0ABS8D3K8_9NEIS|nr:tetratricopeptide repeat protein [Leeia speluncae]MCB6182727.1 sel1 repeat family protein [Leeia speluncae]
MDNPIDNLLQAANEGDANAQFALAKAFGNGNEVEKNLTTAFNWCEKAAQQGHAEAMFILSETYRIGLGIPKNLRLARQWRQAAVKAGWKRNATKADQAPVATWKVVLKFILLMLAAGVGILLLVVLVIFAICAMSAPMNFH